MALKSTGRRQKKAERDSAAVGPLGERQAFTLEIPGTSPDRPAWRLSFEMITEAQGDGERTRLRMHLHSSIAEILAGLSREAAPRQALRHDATAAADSAKSGTTTLAPAYRLAGSGLRLAMAVPGVRRLIAPLTRNTIDSWIEINASTANLADGATSLLPAIEQLKSLGIEAPTASSPPMQTWAGASGTNGIAQVSLFRLDRRHLPAAFKALLAAGLAGGAAFNIAGAIINVVEPTRPARR